MRSTVTAGTLTMALAVAPAFAQSATTQATNQQTTGSTAKAAASTSDQAFVKAAARGGLAEVELGKLAQQKASSNDVKQFGERMVADHSKANDELKSLAESKNITLPTTMSARDQALYDRLSKLSGEAFDRAYIRAMVRDHRKDVNEFRREARSGRDPDVKAFASKTEPTLEEHLKQAREINQKEVATSGTRTRSRTSGTTGTASGAPETNKK